MLAAGGWTTRDARNNIDAWLAAQTVVPDVVLLRFGVNDSHQGLDATTFETNYGYVLDALRTKWPAAKAIVTLPWGRGCVQCGVMSRKWIPEVLAAREWASIGPDEGVWLEGGDDGVTYTSDGLHYNALGCPENANQQARFIEELFPECLGCGGLP